MPHTTQTKEVMTKKIVTVPSGSNLTVAVELMKDNRIRHLPVVNKGDKIIGILSSKDFSNISYPEGYTVDVFMSVPIEWVEPTMPLRSAILRMIEKKISCLLIADEKGEVAGIVTTEDLLWVLAQRLENDEHKQSPLTLFDIQSISEIANQISMTGI